MKAPFSFGFQIDLEGRCRMLELERLHLRLLLAASVFAVGCSESIEEPELGTVTGTVTIDGQPGANLMIQFEPQAAGTGKVANQVGAGSTGTTDAGGAYELSYKGDTLGAVVGAHIVRVTSAAGGGPAGGETGAVQIAIPAIYNTESTLRKDVAMGENKIDLEIKTR